MPLFDWDNLRCLARAENSVVVKERPAPLRWNLPGSIFFLFRVTTQNLFSSGGHQGCLSSLQQNLANDVCAILSHGAGLEAMMGLWRARVSSKKVQGRPLVKVKPQFQWKWQDRRGDGEMLRPSTWGGQDSASWGYSLSCHGDSSMSEMSWLWHEHLGSIDCRVEVTWAHETSCMTWREENQESETMQMH